ncbi:MAG TPA: S41 family peptidase [Acidobacteriaceae bacterium]|jgi:carboxyl-terminal processing protease
MSRAFKRTVFGLSVLLVAFAFLGGLGPSGVRAGSQADGAYPEMEVYSEVLKKIQTDYVVDPNVDKVTVGALHGLLESLDSDSSYLSPDEYKSYKQHQNEGVAQIGINVSKRYGYATVVSVEPGSPARQQIHDGDIIEAIEGHSTREMSLAMIRLLLEGKPGTTVTFSVVRPRQAEPERITLTRTNPPVPPLAEQEYENSSILYLKPVVISKERVQAIENRLHAMQKDGNKKIVLDLRDVTDGDETQGLRLANFFLQSGTIATLSGQKFPLQTFNADSGKFVTAAPLVVLVNHGTSGPAELVAAAILDHKRGDVVGDRTFGEGSVQKTMELPDGSALILSIAKYASPSGKRIQDEAVTPSVVVASAPETEEQGANADKGTRADEQLNKALELLKQKNG